jgi:hypothetical protein
MNELHVVHNHSIIFFEEIEMLYHLVTANAVCFGLITGDPFHRYFKVISKAVFVSKQPGYVYIRWGYYNVPIKNIKKSIEPQATFLTNDLDSQRSSPKIRIPVFCLFSMKYIPLVCYQVDTQT